MTEAQLARERSLGRYAAGAAIIAIVLTVATVAIQASLKSIKWHGHTIKPTSYGVVKEIADVLEKFPESEDQDHWAYRRRWKRCFQPGAVKEKISRGEEYAYNRIPP